MSSNKEDGRPSFAAVLASIRPKTDIELAESLMSLIEAVRATGKAGSIVLRLDMKPADSEGAALIVNDKISLKLPEKNRADSLAYVGEGNRLQRTDPSAMPLFDDEDIRDAGLNLSTGEIKGAPGA